MGQKIIKQLLVSSNLRIVLGGLVVIAHAPGPKVLTFKSGRGRWIVKGDKNPLARLPAKGN
jgi:hypothetical protein